MLKYKIQYFLMVCVAFCMFGCGQAEDQREEAAVVIDSETDIVQDTESPDETVEPEIEKEEPMHPIIEEGIDYLCVEGIELEPGMTISMVGTDSQSSYYNTIKKGASQAVADLNTVLGYSGKDKITFSYTAPKNGNIIDQVNIIDQILDKAPDALCIAYADATACKTQVQMAKNNGIQLIAFDTPDESRTSEALVATDNKKAAAQAASKLFEVLENDTKIAVIVHSSTKQTGQDRYRAITDEYQQNYREKNLHFVDVVYMQQDNRTTDEIFEELLEKHPDLSGILCTDLETTEETIDYVTDLTENNLKIVGFDMSEKIVNAVSDGTILGTVAQDPYGMGYAAVVAGARAIAGLENVKSIHSAYLWVDALNVESKEVQSLQNY